MYTDRYLKTPAYIRSGEKPKRNIPIYEGKCECGGLLNKWANTGAIFCRNCPNPKKAFT